MHILHIYMYSITDIEEILVEIYKVSISSNLLKVVS